MQTPMVYHIMDAKLCIQRIEDGRSAMSNNNLRKWHYCERTHEPSYSISPAAGIILNSILICAPDKHSGAALSHYHGKHM